MIFPVINRTVHRKSLRMRDVMSDFTQYCFRKILPIQLLLLGICFPSKYFKMFSSLLAFSLKHELSWKESYVVAIIESNHHYYIVTECLCFLLM